MSENTGREITPDMVGCWLDGWHGWHNSYRVVDIAEEFGFIVPDEYREALDDFRENGMACGEDSYYCIIGQGELMDKATDYLNERAPEGYVFEWDMGEFILIPESEYEQM